MSTAVRPAARPIGRFGRDQTEREGATSGVGRSDFRPEIQGLRAVAVGLVVLYHLWPNRLSGGYVGVDVFFVISGFLITSHIFREVAETGRLRVGRFWARRIRRLLPASLLVLTLSVIAVVWWLPSTEWATTFRQVTASALYVQNWALAIDSVDYMAADNVPTVAQHYWSLSVEEQFYLVWPLLILGLLAFQRWSWRRSTTVGNPAAVGADARRRIMLTGLALVAIISLAWSVVSTADNQSFAYLSTLTRAWEFAAGAITALVTCRLGSRARTVIGWVGLIAIVWSGWAYTSSSPFPGWIALVPVLGTVAVIASGRAGPTSVGWWLARRPATFIGDLSYSIYLLHWPLIVLVPAITGSSLLWPHKLAILALTLVLAWASKSLVEDPLRTRPLLADSSRRAFTFAVVGMVVVGLGTAAGGAVHTTQLARQQAQSEILVAQGGRCVGPDALKNAGTCGSVHGAQLLVPLDVVRQYSRDARLNSCQTPLSSSVVRECVVGDLAAPVTVALVGDSHAAMWLETLDALGKSRGVGVRVFAKSSCPVTEARRVLVVETTDERARSCEQWRKEVVDRVTHDDTVTDVVTTAFASAYGWTDVPGGPELVNPSTDGFVSIWTTWTKADKRVHVLRDAPTPTRSVPACLASAKSPTACDWARATALKSDTQLDAVRKAQDDQPSGVRLADLTASFCDDETCYAQIGGIPVYRDASHVSREYSRLLAPALGSALRLTG